MGHLNKQYAALRSKNATADWVEIYSEGTILCLYLWHFTIYFFFLLYCLGIYPNKFFIEISSKCSGMKIRTLLHKWFQPIVYCVLPDVIIFFGYFRDWILKSHQFVSTPLDPNHLASFWKLKLTWNKCHCVLFSVCIKGNKFSMLIFYRIWWAAHLYVYLV